MDLVRLLVGDRGSLSSVARELGISPRAVRKWVNGARTQPSNSHLHTIIALAAEADRRGTIALLRQDLRSHRELMRGFLKGLGGPSRRLAA